MTAVRFPEHARRRTLFLLSLSFAVFQLAVPILFTGFLDIQLRAVHITLGLSVALLSTPAGREWGAAEGAMIAVLVAANVNAYMEALAIYIGAVPSGGWDMILGVCLILLVLEGARRIVGWIIPGMVTLLIAYIYFGDVFPGIWKLKGISLRFVIDSLYYSPLGIYGSVTGMSATFIAMFIIFGSLLSYTGGGKTFIDIAMALTGRYRGGPAKASVVASALFGSISGSSIANVMVTGNYTIPLMKRMGYRPEFAGAVEAIASSGGGITPPLMSVAAFMMAEFLGISYFRIIGYALLPCLLYYTGVLSGVHFRTLRMNIGRLSDDEIPRWGSVLSAGRLAGLLVPVGLLVGLTARGQPLQLAGLYAILATLAIFLVAGVMTGQGGERIRSIIAALADGGRDVARIVPILVSVSMLVNLVGIAGIAPKISGLILQMGDRSLYLSLLLATIVPFILGTSLPMIPTYVLSVSILVPPLFRVGIDPVAAHFFFIYCAILGGVTPPVCTTAVAAAGIAKGDWLLTALNAMRLGAVAFILPFFFALNPALVGRAPLYDVLLSGGAAFIGTIGIAYGLFSHRPPRFLNAALCAAFIVGGTLLLFPGELLPAIGVVTVCTAFIVDRTTER